MQNISQLDQKDLDLLFDQDPDDVDLDYCYSKLQQTEFRKFGGDIRDWLSFWSQFGRIHADQALPNEEKLQLLIQATTPKSRARQIVESYPPVGNNYLKLSNV